NKAQSYKLFDRIAGRYDSLNRILSLGIDLYWRRVLSRSLAAKPIKVLDLATGTADQIIDLVSVYPSIENAIGLDLSNGMLEKGRAKVLDAGFEDRITLREGDAQNLPFPESTFQATSISFGIRNIPDVALALREMLRVLVPGGQSFVLEFSTPRNRIFRTFYFFYLRHVLPQIGALLSGDSVAYRYLNQTIEGFPSGNEFCALMTKAGFVHIRARPLTFGIATLYSGEKRAL
ncbi:MAG: bifunctional demethylmenaquinone methyltransferase/2-methoxy-6-polyprenyl-1,4-benzoquinol methylase UbiE, partial [Bdellovibrionota bacterium]